MFTETFFISLVMGTMATFSIVLGRTALYLQLAEKRKRWNAFASCQVGE